VYHLAARVAARLVNASHHLYEQINNWGTAELVYAIEESNVKKLIYTSSIAVYGDSQEVIDINTTPYPRTYYGASKLRGEEHVNRLVNKINAYSLRVANVYGYGVSMRFDTVLNKFMFDAAFKGRIKIFGTGNQYRAFIHIDNLTDVLVNMLFKDIESGIYNVLDESLSVNDLVDNIKTLYPETELLFVNQHLKLRNINIKKDNSLDELFVNKNVPVLERLKDFKERLEKSSI
jgi:UDP-glucose 4-epimerase